MGSHMTYKGYTIIVYINIYKNRWIKNVLAGDYAQVVYNNVKYR